MNGVPGAEAQRLLVRLAGEFGPKAVEIGERPVRIGHPHHHRRVLGHVAEARLAFPQIARRLAPKPRHLEIGVDAGDQFPRGEGLRQIVVGAGVEAFHARLLAGPRRQHDHGQVAQRRVGSQLAQQAEAVEARHHDVGQHEVRLPRADRRQRRVAVGDRLHVPARSEQPADIVAHVGVVVGHEDARAVRSVRRKMQVAARRRRGRPASSPAASVRQPAQRLLDEGVGAQRRRGARPLLADRVRPGGGAVPNGMRDVNVVPRADLALDANGAAVQLAPVPAPGRGRCRSLRTCGSRWPSMRWKRSNSRGSSAAGMPTPVSRTVSSARRRSGEPRSSTAISPSKVNLKAFERRLRTIFSHMSRST